MKILAIVVAVIAVVVGILWLAGGAMAEHTQSIVIPAPPGRVFPFLTDPARLTQWIGGLKSSEPLGDGVLRVGARSRETVEENGRVMVMDSEVTQLELGRLLEVRLEHEMFSITNRLVLSDDAGSTRLTQTLQTRYRGLARLFAPFMKGAVQEKLAEDLDRLRAAVLAEEPPR